MSDCLYCPGTSACKHRSLADRAQRPLTPASGREEIVVPRATQERVRLGSSLFVLHGSLLDLACRLCSAVIPNGPHQTHNRLVHGFQHVRAGNATAITQGLPVGAVRFEIT